MKEGEQKGKPEAVEDPQLEAVEDPQLEAVEEPGTNGGLEPESEAGEPPEPQTEGGPGWERSIEDGLELDRMDVKRAEGIPQEPVDEEEAVIIEPPVPVQEDSGRPGILALLADYWILMIALLLGLSVVSAALLFLSVPEGEREEVKLGRRVHVVNASLGGEHYVRFNLWGPFRDAKGQAALERGMPKIKHDLIISGGRPEVAQAILENDLYFLERHILEIVSNATDIAADQLDLKGLSVTRYSDEAEVEEEE